MKNFWFLSGFLIFLILALSYYNSFFVLEEKRAKLAEKATETFANDEGPYYPIPNDDNKPKPALPKGYYRTSFDDKQMAKIPKGFVINPKNDREILPVPFNQSQNYSSLNNTVRYDPDNYDLTYHQLNPSGEIYDVSFATVNVVDPSGNYRTMPWSPVQEYPIYYEPGTQKYGSGNHVPSYEDSVYLSRANHAQNTYKNAVCSWQSPQKAENHCSTNNKNTCVTDPCCIWYNDKKCVYGDELGSLNYRDLTDKNVDYYYYQNKCYGNCPPA
jgi:hypothetical protein